MANLSFSLMLLDAQHAISLFTKPTIDNAQHHTDKDGSQNGSDTYTAKAVKNNETGDKGNNHHGDVKHDLNLMENDTGNVRNGLHAAFTSQRHDIRRHIEKDTDGDEYNADQHHNDAKNDILGIRQK